MEEQNIEPTTTEVNQTTETPTATKRSTVIEWLRSAGIRAERTAAQAALAIIPVSAVTLGGVDWILVAGAAALAAVISLLNSIAGIPEASEGLSLNKIIKTE